MRIRSATLLLFLFAGAPLRAQAAIECKLPNVQDSDTKFVVVIDLTHEGLAKQTPPGMGKAIDRTAFYNDAPKALVEALEGLRQEHTLCAQQKVLDAWTKAPSSRLFSTTGDSLHIYLLYSDPKKPQINNWKEQTRQTALAAGLSLIAKDLFQDGSGDATVAVVSSSKALTSTRATVTFTAQNQPEDDKDKQSQDITITTGPREHLYLSADLPLNSVNQVKYDSSSHSLASKSAPKLFFVGLNYMVGDVLQSFDDARIATIDRIVVKIMLESSKHPTDGVGIGLGYHLRNVTIPGLNLGLDALQPFVAWVWLKDDTGAPGSSGKTPTTYTSQFRMGISLDISQFTSWFKH